MILIAKNKKVKQRERKKILILGGEGFIGKNLVEGFSKQKLSYNVFSVDRGKSIFGQSRSKFIQKEIRENSLNKSFDAVIQLVDFGLEKGEEIIKNERKIWQNLKKPKQIILFSSSVIYADPDSEYAKRKLILEDFYKNYCLSKGIRLVIFRLFNVFGAYQLPERKGSLVANIFFNFLGGKKIIINDKTVKRDFIWAGDIYKFVHYAIKNETMGFFDLGSGSLISIESLIEEIKKVLLDVKISIDKGDLVFEEKGILERMKCPVSKKPFGIRLTPLRLSLLKTLNFYNKNFKIINQWRSKITK